MKYYLDLFSPATYLAFSKSDRTVSGFTPKTKNVNRVKRGDRFICYMTKHSRWVGILEVLDGPYDDDSPIFDDPDRFTRRFKVKTLAWLDRDNTIPIKEDFVWNSLSFTSDSDSKFWTGTLRSSCNKLDPSDGEFLECALTEQLSNPTAYPIEEKDWRRSLGYKVRGESKTLQVTIPSKEDDEEESEGPSSEMDVPSEARESIKIQALLADIGIQMGLKVWVPRSDKSRVVAEMKQSESAVLDILPLNYDETTLSTIENIDVLWLNRRTIVRAFEVEHTTSIYSGLLRMADLLALQPNLNIMLHIVAPESRKDKVEREIMRPVFSFLDRGPLSEICSYLSYDDVIGLAGQKFLSNMNDTAIDAVAHTFSND